MEYEGFTLHFSLKCIQGNIYGFKELKRLPRKYKKKLKKQTAKEIGEQLPDYFSKHYNNRIKLPKFSYEEM